MLAATVVLASLGPYGTFTHGRWAERFIYWLRTGAVGYLIYRPLIYVAARVAARLHLAEAVGWVAATVFASALLAFWLWWFGPLVQLGRAFPAPSQYADTFLQVLILGGLCVLALWVSTPAASRRAEQVGDAGNAQVGQNLLSRLPAQLGDEICALGMEDHYVRVFTRRGDTLVLMRMSDALVEVGSIPGVQAHRSWWVALDAIETIKRKGRAAEIHLATGLAVPVARERLKDLRALRLL